MVVATQIKLKLLLYRSPLVAVGRCSPSWPLSFLPVRRVVGAGRLRACRLLLLCYDVQHGMHWFLLHTLNGQRAGVMHRHTAYAQTESACFCGDSTRNAAG